MDTNSTSAESFNELVFENRNKEYGAYVIRKSYNDNLSAALFYTISLFGLIALISFLFTKSNVVPLDIKGQTNIVPFISIPLDVTPAPKPEVKVEKIIPPKDVVYKSDNLNLVASDDKKDVIEKTNAEVTIVKNGKLDGKDSVPTEIHEIHIATPLVTPPSEPMIVTDQMPEFTGNLFQYIRDNITYPRMAAENLTSGTVVVQFVVETDGSIGNVKVLKPLEDGCTEEAMRVVKSMPKWKPGKNHGESVRVLFNLPIKFSIK